MPSCLQALYLSCNKVKEGCSGFICSSRFVDMSVIKYEHNSCVIGNAYDLIYFLYLSEVFSCVNEMFYFSTFP